ncbi:MAG TPA: MFS transporter [Acidimicrobiales bacterium]|nr:MFS transporter [Acidimicrobiales bacterium]
MALSLVLVASFMVVLDFSIVNVALPSIHRDLRFGGDSVQWVVTAYAITFGGLMVLGGRIADTVGRRSMFIVGLALFSAASLAAGLSTDAGLLVAARAIQGVGAAVVAPAALSLITARITEGPRRTRALGLYGATASIGYVVGQVLGGVLVEYGSWRLIFLVNVPVGVIAALLAPRLVSADARRSPSARVDVAGGLLITLAVGLAVFAISEGPVLGWAQPLVFGALCVGALALLAFVAVERSQAHPLIDVRLLRRRGLRTAALLTLLVGAWTAGELVVMSVYLQQTLHDSPLMSGLVIAPQGAVGFITGMFSARLMRRLGLRTLLVASTALAGTGFVVLSRLPATGHYNALFAAVLLIGCGTVGTSFGATVMAASGMAAADQGLVSGVVNTTRQVGAAVGVAVLMAIAEGSRARAGVATVGGDRAALLVAGLVALGGAFVAGFGARPRPTVGAPVAALVTPTFALDIPTTQRKGEHCELHRSR